MHTVALITYDISPYRGSEAAVSWNFVLKMHRHVHLIVIYGGDRDEVERYISECPLENVEWRYVPKRPLPTNARGLVEDYYYTLYYRQWHKDVAKLVANLVDAGKVDLIHYLNPIGFKEPGWSWRIKSVPYVWGPVQGVDNRPLQLYKAMGIKGTIAAIVRRIVHNGLFILYPRVRKAFKRADALFAATPATVRGLKKYHGRDVVYLPENGILQMERDTPIEYESGQRLNLIWIGVLDEYRKAFGLLLEALKRVKHTNWHLDVFGKGVPNARNQAIIDSMSERITIHGKVGRDVVQERLFQSHLHIISSLGEATTTVLWEAMTHAVPTMTLDHCGMGGVVCDKCGIKIPIGGFEQVVGRMASEIENLIEHPERVLELSKGVIECSKQYMWDKRIGVFTDTYSRLISSYKG